MSGALIADEAARILIEDEDKLYAPVTDAAAQAAQIRFYRERFSIPAEWPQIPQPGPSYNFIDLWSTYELLESLEKLKSDNPKQTVKFKKPTNCIGCEPIEYELDLESAAILLNGWLNEALEKYEQSHPFGQKYGPTCNVEAYTDVTRSHIIQCMMARNPSFSANVISRIVRRAIKNDVSLEIYNDALVSKDQSKSQQLLAILTGVSEEKMPVWIRGLSMDIRPRFPQGNFIVRNLELGLYYDWPHRPNPKKYTIATISGTGLLYSRIPLPSAYVVKSGFITYPNDYEFLKEFRERLLQRYLTFSAHQDPQLQAPEIQQMFARSTIAVPLLACVIAPSALARCLAESGVIARQAPN